MWHIILEVCQNMGDRWQIIVLAEEWVVRGLAKEDK